MASTSVPTDDRKRLQTLAQNLLLAALAVREEAAVAELRRRRTLELLARPDPPDPLVLRRFFDPESMPEALERALADAIKARRPQRALAILVEANAPRVQRWIGQIDESRGSELRAVIRKLDEKRMRLNVTLETKARFEALTSAITATRRELIVVAGATETSARRSNGGHPRSASTIACNYIACVAVAIHNGLVERFDSHAPTLTEVYRRLFRSVQGGRSQTNGERKWWSLRRREMRAVPRSRAGVSARK